MTTATVQICPVCEGRGQVNRGFYGLRAGFFEPPNLKTECRSCHGAGIVTACPKCFPQPPASSQATTEER